jgi:DNA-directed RNA polymerase sigma subunit (sigma70/sigma32)
MATTPTKKPFRQTYAQREKARKKMAQRIARLEECAIEVLTELANVIKPGGEAAIAEVRHEPAQRRLVEDALHDVRLFAQKYAGR